MSNTSITADKTPWYQWDTGLTVTVSGGEMTECHFANRKQGTAYVQAVIKGKAKVPDELLQVAAPITAYGYIPDGAGGQTYIEQVFEVTARNIPADYTYTKTAQKTIRDAEKARDQAFAAVNHVHDVADQVVGFRDDAKASADAAKKSADSAEYQKGQAKQYADDAGVAFANAQGFATQASSHATAAEWAKNHAKTSETNAAASASEAATSAQEAKTAAGNAASEVLAATKANADAAAQSATDAATAKAGAETAASNAATSASAAADSAAAAAKSAGDAAASVDAINVIVPKSVSVTPTASGSGAIAIGGDAHANGDAAYALGTTASAVTRGVAIGQSAEVRKNGSVAIGSHSVSDADNEFSIGNSNRTREITHVSDPTADNSAATKKYVDGVNTVTPPRMGLSTVTGGLSFAIGPSSNVTGFTSAAIGGANTVTNDYSVAIGRDAKTTRDAEVSFGDPSTGSRYLAGLRDPILTNDGANKHYVDTTTSNALTATVTDTLVTVDDAVAQAPLSLFFKGVSRQDGTPSVDNPVEVQVVTQPVVTVAGKNLQRYPFPYKHAKTETINGLTFIDNGDGSISVSGTPTAITFYNLDLTSDAEFLRNVEVKASMGGIDYSVECFTTNNTVYPITSNKLAAKAFPSDTKMIRNYVYTDKYADATLYPQFERGKTATAYEPYSGQTVAITLPEEHPYLASLPDGTADEVVIDAYGNVTLVTRVQKVDISNLPAPSAETALPSGLTRYQYWQILELPAKNDTAAISPAFASVVDYTFPRQGMYVSNVSLLVGAASDPTESLRAGGYIYTTLATAKTYNLGKVSLPSLKAGVSNVWIDGGMGGAVTMTYKQDANKVIAGLKSAIAALTSKAANDEARTSEPTIESDPAYSTGEPTVE